VIDNGATERRSIQALPGYPALPTVSLDESGLSDRHVEPADVMMDTLMNNWMALCGGTIWIGLVGFRVTPVGFAMRE